MTTRHLWESLCIINMVVHRVFHSVIHNWRKGKDFFWFVQEWKKKNYGEFREFREIREFKEFREEEQLESLVSCP